MSERSTGPTLYADDIPNQEGSLDYAQLLADATAAARRMGEVSASPEEAREKIAGAEIVFVAAEHNERNAQEIADQLQGCNFVLFEGVEEAEIKRDYQDDLNRILRDPNDFTVYAGFQESVVRKLSPDTAFVGLVDIDEEATAASLDMESGDARSDYEQAMYTAPYVNNKAQLNNAIELTARSFRGREDHTFRQIYEFTGKLPRDTAMRIGIVQGAAHSLTRHNLIRAEGDVTRKFAIGQADRDMYILHGYFDRAIRKKVFKPDKDLSDIDLKRAALNVYAADNADLLGEEADRSYNVDLFGRLLSDEETDDVISSIDAAIINNESSLDDAKQQVRVILQNEWERLRQTLPLQT